jgi:hypothetical protein
VSIWNAALFLSPHHPSHDIMLDVIQQLRRSLSQPARQLGNGCSLSKMGTSSREAKREGLEHGAYGSLLVRLHRDSKRR